MKKLILLFVGIIALVTPVAGVILLLVMPSKVAAFATIPHVAATLAIMREYSGTIIVIALFFGAWGLVTALASLGCGRVSGCDPQSGRYRGIEQPYGYEVKDFAPHIYPPAPQTHTDE